MISVSIDPGKSFQQIDGFGVNFNGPYFRESAKPMVDMLIDDLGASIFRLDAYGFDLSNWEVVNDNDDPAVMNWDFYNDRYSLPNFEASWAAGRYINSKGGRIMLAAIGIAPEWMLDDKAPPPRHRVCSNKPKPCKLDHLNPAMCEEFAEMLVSMAMYARMRAHVDFEYFKLLAEKALPCCEATLPLRSSGCGADRRRVRLSRVDAFGILGRLGRNPDRRGSQGRRHPPDPGQNSRLRADSGFLGCLPDHEDVRLQEGGIGVRCQGNG